MKVQFINNIIFTLAFFPIILIGQRTIKGYIYDKKGEALIGATVRVVGTTSGTVTDIDGYYSIIIPVGTIQLLISYTGYSSEVVTIGSSNHVNVTLSGDNKVSTNKRWSLSLFGGHNITSVAIIYPIGITNDYGGRYWAGSKFGYDFVARPKIRLGLDIGVVYRDYGFKENNSSIPYITGLVNLHFRKKLFWRISLLANAGGEYGKLYEKNYKYSDAATNSTRHNIFLHQNDALMITYGGGLSLLFNRFGIDLGFERNLQLDTYDKQYGKTIGGRFSNVALYYYVF